MIKRKKLKKSDNLFRVNELGKKVWITLAVGYKETKDMSIFESKEGARMAFKICEEYANSGIDILNEMMKKPNDFTFGLIDDILKSLDPK